MLCYQESTLAVLDIKKTEMIKFSVCMSVYYGDNADNFRSALESVCSQSLLPSEVILVVDGPVGKDINNVIASFEKREIPLRVIRLEKNSGHAVARQTGLEAAQTEYIAIMDSDDIAELDRFEKQISFIANHPEIEALGGQIDEFVNDTNNVVGSRVVPLSDADIKHYLKSRCPMNLVTVLLKKKAVQKAGGYIDWYCEEDYYLWVRMTELGMKFANLPDKLVNVRVGEEMYQRRGGWRYFKSEIRLQNYMRSHGLISLPRFVFNGAVRLVVQVLMPNWLRGFVFQKMFRK